MLRRAIARSLARVLLMGVATLYLLMVLVMLLSSVVT